MFRILYDAAISAYGGALRLAAPFNNKARQWIDGRRDQELSRLNLHKPVWVHCSSLGEFEQGRPVMEMIKSRFPQQDILLSFFSPSGYTIRKDFAAADAVVYLPVDKPERVKHFLTSTDPGLVIMVKYDFWYHYLRELGDRQIPFLYVAALFHRRSTLFRQPMSPLLRLLHKARCLFVQNTESEQLLRDRGFENVVVAGDPRIDRVLSSAPDSDICAEIETDTYSEIFVFGSVWMEDLEICQGLIRQLRQQEGTLVIVAPHDISQRSLRLVGNITGIETRYSMLATQPIDPSGGIILDTIGDLSSLYHCASIAYIGGGFGRGIHNILEPAAAGIPVLFGPRYQAFQEAHELLNRRCAYSVSTVDELNAAYQEFSSPTRRQEVSRECQRYLAANRGATGKIVDWLETRNMIPTHD